MGVFKLESLESEQRLILFTIFYFTIVKITLLFSTKILTVAATYVQDCFTLMVPLVIAMLLSRWKIVSKIAFYALYLIIFIITFVYNNLLSELLQFDVKVNIFNVGWESANHFFNMFISRSTIAIIFFSIVGLVSASVFITKIKPSLFNKKILVVLGVLFIISVVYQPLNPLVHSIMKGSPENSLNDLEPVENMSFDFLEKDIDVEMKLETEYDRVLVFVMETVTQDDFQNESGFFKTLRTESVQYTNYHTLNLDSLTSLISLLYSKFVPYKAYGTKATYMEAMKNKESIVEMFENNNFTTVFVASEERPCEISRMINWSHVIKEENYSITRQDVMCFIERGGQRSCEDISLLDEVVENVEKNDKIFLFQEFLYGHYPGNVYEKGIPHVKYYNDYMEELFNRLEEKELLDDTLIILVSDHGSREEGPQFEKSNYNLPLLFWAKDVSSGVDTGFYSQVDFNNILLHHMGVSEKPSPSKEIFTVGTSTQNVVYGTITSDGSYAFIETDSMRVKSEGIDTDYFLRRLKTYQDHFEEYKMR